MATAFRTEPGDHRFFSTMSVLAAVVVLTGFSRTYVFGGSADAPAPPLIVHVHAAIFACWLAFFVAQTTLVRTGRVDIHRKLGVAGVVLAALMLIVGVAAAITVARLDHRGIPGVEFPDAEGFLLLNLAAIFVFSTLVGAGWYFRRSSQTHKRLMLMATPGALMPPGIARLPLVSGHTPAIGGMVLLFLLAGPIYDLVSRRRLHPAYIWSVLLAFVSGPPIVAPLAASGAWHSVAAWLMR